VITVCLQTCDRADLTERTLSSLAAHNDLSRFDLLHADDASVDDRNDELAATHGFTTVVKTRERLGIASVRTSLIRAAKHRSASWVLLLENDIESVRPFPWPLFDFVRQQMPSVYCLRLYGRYKDREQQEKCLETHKHQGHKPVQWRPLRKAPEGSQIGIIHWSPQPAATRMQELWAYHCGHGDPDAQTVRVKSNVMVHIGAQRTPGRML
jgi:hypothetical protein